MGRHISGKVLREIITEIDTNNNGQVELDEYLQVRTKYKKDLLENMYDINSFSVGTNRIHDKIDQNFFYD